jgi:transposase
MQIRLTLNNRTRRALLQRLHQAYQGSDIRLIRRVHCLLCLADGKAVAEVARWLNLGEQTVYDYVRAFLLKGLSSLVYKRPSGRPSRLTKTQRRELGKLIDAGPEKAGYDEGCWTAVLIQDLIEKQYGVVYHPHYVAELLKTMGFSYQKGRFESDYLDKAARAAWMAEKWPAILRLAKQKHAMILFGDEASFAQWGSLSYTWSRVGRQPTIPTSGKRKAYKVFGLIDFFTGQLFYRGHTGRFNSDSYAEFLVEVIHQTLQHVILIQDGAKYHTSKAMQQFFNDHTDRLTMFQLPSYSPDFNPIEFLWKKVKKHATHLRYFPDFDQLVEKVEATLLRLANTPSEITALMGRYCESLGEVTE